jgi:hypothetical protein
MLFCHPVGQFAVTRTRSVTCAFPRRQAVSRLQSALYSQSVRATLLDRVLFGRRRRRCVSRCAVRPDRSWFKADNPAFRSPRGGLQPALPLAPAGNLGLRFTTSWPPIRLGSQQPSSHIPARLCLSPIARLVGGFCDRSSLPLPAFDSEASAPVRKFLAFRSSGSSCRFAGVAGG